jgi:hypothetical protein
VAEGSAGMKSLLSSSGESPASKLRAGASIADIRWPRHDGQAKLEKMRELPRPRSLSTADETGCGANLARGPFRSGPWIRAHRSREVP